MLMIVLLAAAMAPAPARPAKPLAPSTDWALVDQPAACRVERSFGRGSSAVALKIAKSLLSERSVVAVELPRPVAVAYGEDVRLIVEPDGGSETGPAFGFTPGMDGQRAVALSVRDAVIVGRPASVIGVEVREARVAHLAAGDLAPVMATLRDCEDRVARTFGVDPADYRTLSSWPVPMQSMETWFTADSYPPAAIRAGAQGRVGVRFTVAADGAVRDCAPVLSTGHVDLDQGTCRIVLARARYQPARDRAGRAVSAPQLLFTRWVLP